MRHILSWSGGKDSTAAVILCHELGLPLDEIIFCEVMYDLERNISGENPLHIDFIYNVAKPMFESWGYKVTILRSDRDYLYCFNHVMDNCKKYPEHNGRRYGFPLNKRCAIQRDCKLRPIKKYMKEMYSKEDCVYNYLGICIDEPKRLQSMHKNPFNISILEERGVTEKMARELCVKYGLLSPGYEYSERGGCWMCCNSKVYENAFAKQYMPGIWNEFVQLEEEQGCVYSRWNAFGDTLAERNRKVDEFLLDADG